MLCIFLISDSCLINWSLIVLLRCLQEVHLDKHIKLLDCPGIVMATSTSDAAMILRNCVKIEQLVDPLPAIEAILRRCNKTQASFFLSVCAYVDNMCSYVINCRNILDVNESEFLMFGIAESFWQV